VSCDVLPLNYSPISIVKWLFYNEKQLQRRENIDRSLVANVTVCSR
jgi:hypothetical protein